MNQEFEQFQKFKNKEFLNENELAMAENYIYFRLLNDYDDLQMYAYSNCIIKCKIVLNFKKSNNLEIKTKLGEAICDNNLVNFIEDLNHQFPTCTCGSTYGNVVFHS